MAICVMAIPNISANGFICKYLNKNHNASPTSGNLKIKSLMTSRGVALLYFLLRTIQYIIHHVTKKNDIPIAEPMATPLVMAGFSIIRERTTARTAIAMDKKKLSAAYQVRAPFFPAMPCITVVFD
jgi:hypothetical protein